MSYLSLEDTHPESLARNSKLPLQKWLFRRVILSFKGQLQSGLNELKEEIFLASGIAKGQPRVREVWEESRK